MKVEVQNVSWGVEAKLIIRSISLEAKTSEFIGIIGPNGSGKSSLLKLIYRIYSPKSGVVYIDGHDIENQSFKKTAQQLAVVTQERNSEFDFSVYEMVMMGRTPHKNLLDSDTKEDDTVIRRALKRVGILTLSDRLFHTLSGGEKQRVLIARALAQNTKILILDEPTNHLDIRYQFEIMELIRSLGITTITAMHDLNLAASYCNRIYLLKSGKIVAHGHPRSVLTKNRIKSVYDVNVEIETRLSDGQLNIVFSGIHSPRHLKSNKHKKRYLKEDFGKID